MKLIVGITGASGVGLGIKFLEKLPLDIEVYCVISNSAKVALKFEQNGAMPNNSNILFYDDSAWDPQDFYYQTFLHRFQPGQKDSYSR